MHSSENIPAEEGAVTRLLRSWHDGDATAQQQLMEVVYAQLRRMAARSMQSQNPNHTLRPTELVHEAWLKLNGGQGNFINRSHFLGVAARAMRSILIDYARAKGSQKRFGSLNRVPFEAAVLTAIFWRMKLLSNS